MTQDYDMMIMEKAQVVFMEMEKRVPAEDVEILAIEAQPISSSTEETGTLTTSDKRNCYSEARITCLLFLEEL